MFDTLPEAQPDAIFGLNEAMRKDPRPEKINLGAGVYKDEAGQTPVLEAVKRAEKILLEHETSKSYLPIGGLADYNRGVRRLLFEGHAALEEERVVTVQTPGGTGALRVAGDFLRHAAGVRRLFMSQPTWPNHPQVFDAVGLHQESYPYFDRETNGLALEAMLEALGTTGPGDAVLLHGCCHNPTGVDPDAEGWARISELLAERGALPMVDFAYQGFARGVEKDVEWLGILAERVPEIVICSSFSKNFGLYNERTGALTFLARSAEAARAVRSQVKRTVRANYSNPPAHGARVVAQILGDPELEPIWREELARMRDRIQRMREVFAAGLDERGAKLQPAGNDFIARQKGMFSFSGLGPEQVERLRGEAAIYIVGSGRINVAGITESNVGRLCDAVASVL